MEIKFKDKDHELNYLSLFQQMKKQTPPHQAVAYLLALDLRECHTIPKGLDKAWNTLASRRTTRLAFNLFDGQFSDGETYIGSDGFEEMLPSRYYTPFNFFGCDDAPYYVEAVRIRFPKFWKI